MQFKSKVITHMNAPPLNPETQSPDIDAKEYIEDVIQVCFRNAALLSGKDDPFEEREDEEDSPYSLEATIEHFLEYPEELVELGFLTWEEFDEWGGEPDEALVEDFANQMIDKWLAEDMGTYYDPSYDEYDGVWNEEREETDWVDEEVILVSELLAEIKEALDLGETEQLLKALDDLFDQMPDESEELREEELGNIEHWAQLLTKHILHLKKEDFENQAVQQIVLQAVKNLAARLCEIIADNGRALQYVEWRQLEEVVATALEGIGFNVTLTPPSKDGGKDVIASCILQGRKLTFYIEVKHWRSGKRVNTKPILDFVQINVSSLSQGGLFLSTSGYDNCIFTCLSELHRGNVRLGDAQKVITLCQHFTRYRQGLWIPEATLPNILFEDTMG